MDGISQLQTQSILRAFINVLLRRFGDHQTSPSTWHVFQSNQGGPDCTQDERVKESQSQPKRSLLVCLNKDCNNRKAVFASSLQKESQ